MVTKSKLLVICGPTATGKTSLALTLAAKFDGEIVSADSRQVYKYMDIGTGKDLPKGVKYKTSGMKLPGVNVGYYEVNSVKIWGYDIAVPTQEFSVSQYAKVADKVVKDILTRGKLPIVAGGTGLYIKALIDGIETVNIPRNALLRESLVGKSATKLFEILSTADPIKAASMNQSDKKNPRRLMRAIEIAVYVAGNVLQKKKTKKYDSLLIGLSAGSQSLADIIRKRVGRRWREGIVDEIRNLFKLGVTWDSQAMDALGYKQWKGYFEGKVGADQVLKTWCSQEVKYAKRQMTWFKKDKRIVWFDIEGDDFKKEIEMMVDKWYKNSK